MGIEDVPEMEILNRKWEIPSFSEPFDGHFLVALLGRDERETYVFGCQCLIEDIQDKLRERLYIYGNEEWRDEHSSGFGPISKEIIGVGDMHITNGKIVFYEDPFSGYPKYDEQIVRPIVERWKQQNLPDHEIVFR